MSDRLDKAASSGVTGRRRGHLGALKTATVAASVATALASFSSSATASSVFAASDVPADALMTVVAGQGSSGFGTPALGVGLQANGRVATDPAGNIYVSSQFDQQVGKIAAPSTWRPQIVSTMTATPTFGGPFPAASQSRIRYQTVDGEYSATWSDPDVAPNEEIGVQPHPTVKAGSTYTASVTLVGAGQVFIRVDTVDSPVVTLSGTPQTVSLTLTPNSTSVVFQIRTPSTAPDQPGFTVSASDFSLGLPQVTGTTSVVAGNGNVGYSGDGGPATQATLGFPGGVAADAKGDVYIADRANNVVRRVAPDGIITTVAGTGTPGYSGDGHAATRARLDFPGAVAVDGIGDLYIADTDNNAIRKVTPAGTITTVAGGSRGSLSLPEGVAVDDEGDVFIADTANSRIDEVTAAGDLITVAGTGTAGFSGDSGPAVQAQLNSPFAVAVDAAGVVYIADTENNRIREIAPDGTISTLVGDGTAAHRAGSLSQAEVDEPFSVGVDNITGDLYIAGNARAIDQVSGLPVPSAG